MCIGTAHTGSEDGGWISLWSSSHGRDVAWRREGYQRCCASTACRTPPSPEKNKRERKQTRLAGMEWTGWMGHSLISPP